MNFEKTLEASGAERGFQTLEELKERLRQTEKALREKSIALEQVLAHIETEKEVIQSQVLGNISKLLMPILAKLKRKATQIETKYLDLIQHNLENLTDSFASGLPTRLPGLTHKEIEICNMLRNGFVTKDIAELLRISPTTVERHRHGIRKKFGISKQKVNLTSYLQNR